MSNRITDLTGFHFGDHMTRIGASIITYRDEMMVLEPKDLQQKIWSELVFNVTKELTRAILAGEIPAEIFVEDTAMGDHKVKLEIVVVQRPMEMIKAINEELPFYSEDTLKKFRDILIARFEGDVMMADDIINDMQNIGLLLRERRA